MKLKEILELSRWKEHVFYVVPLSLLGVILGANETNTGIDFRVIWLVSANIMANAFAFMFNDIEDAADDAKDKNKKQRNPISAGRISRKEGIQATKAVLALSVLFYSLCGILPLLTGTSILILSHLYSWKSLRLKSIPVVDIVSHVLMLGTLLVYSGFTVYSSHLSAIWLIGMAVALFSTYGQLYNQYRDYENDKEAGLNNTASLLNETVLKRLMNSAAVIGGITLVIAVWEGYFPHWLFVPLTFGAIASFYIKPNKFMGISTSDKTASAQLQTLIPLNIVVFSWFLYEVIRNF